MSFSASKDILEMPQAALQSSKVLNLQGGSPVTTNHDINPDPIWIGMSSIKIKTCKNSDDWLENPHFNRICSSSNSFMFHCHVCFLGGHICKNLFGQNSTTVFWAAPD